MVPGGAFHQGFAALGMLGRDGEAVVVLGTLLDGDAGELQVGLEAPYAARGLVGIDGHHSRAVLKGHAGRRAVAGFHESAAARELGGVQGLQHFRTDALVDLHLVDDHREVLGGGVGSVVGVGGDLAQVEAKLRDAVLGGGEVGLDALHGLIQPEVPHLAAEGLPLVGGAVFGNEVSEGGGGGLGPDLDLVVRAGLHVQVLDEADGAVALAGVDDVDDERAVLERAGGVSAVHDGFPAVGVGGVGGGEVELLEQGGFTGLLGDGQRGIGFRRGAGLVGDGVDQLIGTGVLRGGFAALEVQGGSGFHGDHPGDIPVLGVCGGNAGQRVEALTRFHRRVLNALDGGLLVLAGSRGRRVLAAAGRQGQEHQEGQQNCKRFLHEHILSILYLPM